MPDLGEGIHEAEVLSIPVSAGQPVKEGETILEVETDKAVVEIPSPVSETVAQVVVNEGDMVTVGDVMIVFGGEPSAASPVDSRDSDTSASHSDTSHRPLPPRVPASPATRRLARESGIDLRLVPPTGPGGVVTAQDVKSFVQSTSQSTGHMDKAPAPPAESKVTVTKESLPDFSQWGPIERHPFRSIRKATAARMMQSWSRIPHVTCQDTVDISELEAFRQRHKTEVEQAGGRLTITVFALKAVVTALKQFPFFNASLDPEAGEIIIKHYFHVGVAVDTEHGLMVPVIRDIDRKSIKELAIEFHERVGRCRARTAARDELQGGTFTITNAGAIGGGFFSPIIHYPEVAILGMGQGRMQPTIVTSASGDYSIKARLIMPIMLCFDHRVVDGADAIRFLQVVMDGLQDPDELLITMI